MTRPADAASQLTVGTTAERIAEVSPAARTVHRAVLHAFARHRDHTGPGRPRPGRRGRRPGRVAGRVARPGRDPPGCDRRDPRGVPVSARPTAHVVDIDGGPSVYAMCAIDAPGRSAMLGCPVTIRSTEPDTGAPITVTVHNGRTSWSATSPASPAAAAAAASGPPHPIGRARSAAGRRRSPDASWPARACTSAAAASPSPRTSCVVKLPEHPGSREAARCCSP
jgi:hypothetical protein